MDSGSSATRTSDHAGVLESILEQMRAGQAPDAERLAAEHPEIADDIEQLVKVLQFVHGAAEQSEPPSPLPAGSVTSRASLAGPLEGRAGDRPMLGDFEIVREVARGGMGVVYEAVQRSLGRRVALKVMLPGAHISGDALERFSREAKTAGALQHRHIVPVIAVGEEDGVPFYAMQYIDGRSLSEHLKQARAGAARLDDNHFRQVASWGVQVAEALDYAHRCGVVHRDVKPSNMLLDAEGALWLTDFGLARQDLNATITVSGDIIGTVRYMSPEQARGGGQIDERTDVYSLGVSLYELTCLRPAVDGPNRESALKQVLLDEPRPLRQIDRRIPRPLATIIHTAMEKGPADRYPSAALLRDDLNRFLEGRPLVAQPRGALSRFVRLAARHKGPFALLALLFVVITAFAIAMAVLYRQADDLRQSAEHERGVAEDAKAVAVAELTRARQVEQFLQRMIASVDPIVARGRDDAILRQMLADAARRAENELADVPEAQAAIRDTIGLAYLQLGLFDLAEPHLETALGVRQKLFGERHLETLRSMIHLALLRQEQGRADDAEELYTRLLRLAEETDDVDEVTLLEPTGNYATLLAERGDLDRAAPMLARSLELHERHFGEQDPRTLSAMGNLAAVLRQGGDLDRAEELYRRALAISRPGAEEDDPRAFIRMHNLARLRYERGDRVEAEALYREALAGQRSVLTATHPQTLATMQSLGVVLAERGALDEAAALLQEALDGQIELLGAAHDDTVQTLYTLAKTRLAQGDREEGELLLLRMVDTLREAGREEHEDTIGALTELAFLRLERDKPREAVPLFARAFELAARVYPSGNMLRAAAQSNYGRGLTAAGRFDDAEPHLLESFEVFRTILPEGNQTIRDAARRLVALYDAWGKSEQAQRYRALAGEE